MALAAAVANKLRETCEIRLGPAVADTADDLAGGDVERGDQTLSAMTEILELTPLDLCPASSEASAQRAQRLNAGHLVDRHRVTGLIRPAAAW